MNINKLCSLIAFVQNKTAAGFRTCFKFKPD